MPRRCRDEAPVAQVAYSDRIATVAEVVPEAPGLPPLAQLPVFEPATAAPVMLTIPWIHRPRRERLKSVLGQSAAWTVTLGVIAVTVAGATVLTLGADKSSSLAAVAGKQGVEAAAAAAATLKQYFKH